MQVNSIDRTSFEAKIVPSQYLNKAIELAKADALSGTKEGRKRAEIFYNNLKTIELDNNYSKLSIVDKDKKLPPILCLDGTRFFIEKYNGIAKAVQEAVKKMAEAKYFNGEVKNYAEKENLAVAFNKWVK